MSNFKTILHPTDFSPSASEALQIASSLARQHGAKLILLHVAQRPIIDWPALQAQLNALAAGTKIDSVEARVVEGDPAGAIVDLAREAGADVIVIGSHGRTGLGRLLMGSVAEHVVRKASCPVLTVKTPAK
jgi:nucleotide-binding universal stress UspA family protein